MRIYSQGFLWIIAALFAVMGMANASTSGSGQLFTSLLSTAAGILGVDDDGVWLSTDNGASFTSVYDEVGERYFALAAAGTTVVAAGEEGLLLRSSNSGVDWSPASGPSFFGNLLAVASNGSDIWMAVGEDGFDGVVLRSTDDGQNWTQIAAPAASGLRAIAWQADTGWVVAGEGSFQSGIIYHSLNNGDSWQLLADDLDAPINAVAINTAGEIAVVGENGLILQGTTSDSFEAPDGYTPVSENLLSVVSTDSGSFIVGGQSGVLLTSDNDGVTDNSLVDGPDITAIVILADDGLLISGDYTPPAAQERTQPFNLQLQRDAGTGDFILTVAETLVGRNYRIEVSTDLQNWTEVGGSERAGTGGPQSWILPQQGTRLFWRAVEF